MGIRYFFLCLPCRTAVARLAFKRRAIVMRNSIPINQLNVFCIISIYYALFAYITYGATVLGSTFETAAVLSSCHFRAKFI